MFKEHQQYCEWVLMQNRASGALEVFRRYLKVMFDQVYDPEDNDNAVLDFGQYVGQTFL